MDRRPNSIETDDRSLSQLLDLGQALVRAGDVKGAAKVYQIACLRHPFDPAPWVGAGLCQKRLGDSRAAELALAIAEALGADHPAILVHRAECRARRGKNEQARADLEAALYRARKLDDTETVSRARRALSWLESQEVTP